MPCPSSRKKNSSISLNSSRWAYPFQTESRDLESRLICMKECTCDSWHKSVRHPSNPIINSNLSVYIALLRLCINNSSIIIAQLSSHSHGMGLTICTCHTCTCMSSNIVSSIIRRRTLNHIMPHVGLLQTPLVTGSNISGSRPKHCLDLLLHRSYLLSLFAYESLP